MNTELVIEKLVVELKAFLGNRNAIVGLSGGVDSAVIALLCKKAIGAHRVFCYAMPYGDQSSQDAIDLALTHGLTISVDDVTEAVDAFPQFSTDPLAKGNVKARVRMINLYGHANMNRGMVIGTGNKTEMLLGYFTKYGDGGVDVEPIAELYKAEVWELARALRVNPEIVNKSPSAELWDNQTDEDEISKRLGTPVTYPMIDDILKYLEGEGEDARKTYPADLIEAVLQWSNGEEHKRNSPPSFDIRYLV